MSYELFGLFVTEMSKYEIFFIKITLFGQDYFKIIVFYTFLLDFSSIFGFYEN